MTRETWPVFAERDDGVMQITITIPLWHHKGTKVGPEEIVNRVRYYVDNNLGYEISTARLPRPRVAHSEAKRSHDYAKRRLPKPLAMMGRAGRMKWLCANINDAAAYL